MEVGDVKLANSLCWFPEYVYWIEQYFPPTSTVRYKSENPGRLLAQWNGRSGFSLLQRTVHMEVIYK